ncbi:Retrovirus-related Pol polyprotein from transposon TNT 1-94 [Linum grandiflorum]
MTASFGKLDKFEGVDFRRWQKKMHFLLTTLKVVYVLSTPYPSDEEDETDEQKEERVRRQAKWDNDDYICRGHILNGMADALFDIYQNYNSASELWDALESKYLAEDASSTKFLVSNFLNYKMVESRPVMEQYNEMLRILGQFTQHDMKMDEAISVSCIIDKLPPSWKDYKHTLKHGKEELSLVQLGSHLRIEESLRVQEGAKPKDPSSVHMMEEGESSKRGKGKKRPAGKDKGGPKKKTKASCWTCGKSGHLKRDCPTARRQAQRGNSGSKDPEASSSKG